MISHEGNFFYCTVTPQEAGVRLDIFLSQKGVGGSRSQIKKSISEGFVLVNGKNEKVSYRIKKGDYIQLQIREAEVSQVLPQPIHLRILYEDSHLLVVDKPAGMVVHPAAGHFRDTLVNALLHHCKDLSGIGGVLRPGIVHRLDKGTSGLIVVAKSDEAHRGLSGQFRRHEVKKIYKALVYGNPERDEGVVDAPLGRHPVERKKMSIISRRSKEALTRWYVAERYGVATLLDVDIVTGRTHQIRVHMKTLGHPVVGDSVYGNLRRADLVNDQSLRTKLKAMKRQALHASKLTFTHPITREVVSFSSPLPDDMAELCEYLRLHSSR